MLEPLRLYLKFLKIALRSRMQYRSDFLIGLGGVIMSNGVSLALIWVILQRFHSLQGWSYWEIVMLYSMWLMSHTGFSTFFWQVLTLEDVLIQGGFDKYLLRPTSPFLQFIGRDINYAGLADVILAVVIFVIAYRNLGLDWSLGQFLMFALVIPAGTAIETSIFILIASVSFWTGRSRSLFQVSIQFNILARQYPLDLFGSNYQLFVTLFLPVAFVNYYPLAQLLGKPNGLNIPLLGFLSPVVAVIMVGLAATGWHYGLRNYASSGS